MVAQICLQFQGSGYLATRFVFVDELVIKSFFRKSC